MSKKTWTDSGGKVWKASQRLGRLKYTNSPQCQALREFVFKRDNYKCQDCGDEAIDREYLPSTVRSHLVLDHITLRRNGGSHHPDNLQALCNSCNSRKAGKVDAKYKR